MGPYLAGLIEGDGYIYAPVTSDSISTVSKGVAHIEIVFDIRDIKKMEKMSFKLLAYNKIMKKHTIFLVNQLFLWQFSLANC